MPSLKEIRTRLSSVQSTKKITSAMKMVAASRLRKVQNYIVYLRDYSKLVKIVLEDVMEHVPSSAYSVFSKERINNDTLLICIGSNKGLCGTYNAFLIKHSLREIYRLQEEGARVSVMPVGRKIHQFFTKREFNLFDPEDDYIEKVDYNNAKSLANQVMKLYLAENFARVVIVYNRFRNAVVHELTTEQVLPVPIEEIDQDVDNSDVYPEDLSAILEPEREEVVEYMTRKFIYYNFYRIMLDASASEHGSRMTAMHKATDNADEMIKNLTLSYNKVRQATVTRELIDIVGGAQRTSR